MDIYAKLEKPIYSLAPMEDVTDVVFRSVVSKGGRPDLFYTEFVNVDGLNSKGKEKVIHRLKYGDMDTPIIVQLWGSNPENFYKSAKFVSELGFSGIDINMGCSVKKVSNNGSGSGLINTPTLALEIIDATKKGAGSLPVSVKTRLGWEFVNMEGWISLLLKQELRVLTVHCRTARGKGAINADWSYISEIIKLRDTYSPNTLIFGNGDVDCLSKAENMVNTYGVDGVMIGRSSISNPWVFSGREDITYLERLEMFKYHVDLWSKYWIGIKNVHELRKFLRAYIKDFDGANQIRQEFMELDNIEEISSKLELLLKS